MLEERPYVTQRIESWKTDADQHRIFRARLRLNPAILWGIYQVQVQAIPKNATNRKAQLIALQKQYVQMQKQSRNIQFVAEVDYTAATLKRMEMWMKSTNPSQSCSLDTKTGRSICKTTSNTSITVTGGITYSKDYGPAVTEPFNWITMEDLLKEITAKMEATSTTMMPGSSTGTTWQ
jgi:hypothetical protein